MSVVTLRGPSTGDRTSSWHPGISSFAQTSLIVLMAVDAVFVAMHVSHRLDVPAFLGVQYELTREGSYAELFQYAKEFGIGLMLAALACRHRSATYGVWALVFGFLLLDDSLMVQEQMGERLVQALDIVPRFGLRAVDIGELVFDVSVGVVVALAIAVLLLRARPGLRSASCDHFLLLVGLALFGVVVDLLHSMAVGRGISGFGVPGDGSEMVVMSLIFAYVHALVPRLPRSIS